MLFLETPSLQPVTIITKSNVCLVSQYNSGGNNLFESQM